MTDTLFLAVDGGGTRCRARLAAANGRILGEGLAGPANIRLALEESFTAIGEATRQCLTTAGFNPEAASRVVACLALAGATEPVNLAAAKRHPLPFHKTAIVPDVQAACVGAHRGADGGVVVIGTGSIGWGIRNGETCRVGGWGFPVSDEGSGAWIGCEAARQTLRAHDGRAAWTPLSAAVFEHFGADPHAIVRFMSRAKPRDFAALAPLVATHAERRDDSAIALLRAAAAHIEILIARLNAMSVSRVALTGGLSATIERHLAPRFGKTLVPPVSDALDGALLIARKLEREEMRA